jgi:hypothetical protein
MAEAISLTAHTGLVIQPYRNDRGDPAWVFRCWGTDTCDGWLSLDHSSEQSAARALTSHLAEFHSAGVPAPEVKVRISGGLTALQRGEVERIVEDYMRRAKREIGRQA